MIPDLKPRTVLLIFLFLFIPLTSVITLTITQWNKNKLIGAVINDQRSQLAAIIDERSAQLRKDVDDYGAWDNLVNFLRSPTKAWPENNILKWISRFDADAIWLYTNTGAPFYTVQSEVLQGIAPVPGNDIPKIFEKDRFCHYFIVSPKGLLEVRGATIHPSRDSVRRSQPKGFLLVGRLWTSDYIAGLSNLWRSRIDIVHRADGDQNSYQLAKGVISFTYVLRDGTGQPAAEIETDRPSTLVEGINRYTNTQLALNALFLLLALLIAVALLITLPAKGSEQANDIQNIIDDAPQAEPETIPAVKQSPPEIHIHPDYLAMTSRVIKRADYKSLSQNTVRDRFELESRIKKRMNELIQSYEPVFNDEADVKNKTFQGLERRTKPRGDLIEPSKPALTGFTPIKGLYDEDDEDSYQQEPQENNDHSSTNTRFDDRWKRK